MAGGKGKIHEHPNHNTQGFDKHPENIGDGRPKKFVSELKDRGYSLSQVQDCIKVLLSMEEEELEKIVKKGELNDKKATILEIVCANAIRKDKARGELNSIEKLLTRAFGQPKQEIEIPGGINININGL